MRQINNENVFIALAEPFYRENEIPIPTPSQEGKEQFFRKQSYGEEPKEPNPYYIFLMKGKWSLDFLSTEYHKMWRKREWWGWYLLWEDWEGKRWLLPYLTKWYPEETGKKIPKWVTLEISLEELRKIIS